MSDVARRAGPPCDRPAPGVAARPPHHDALAIATLAGAGAGLAVAAAGGFASPAIWVLATATAGSYFALAWRARREPVATDRFAVVLQLAFLGVLCAAAWDHRDDARRLPADATAVELAGLLLIGAGAWLRRRAVAALGRHFTVKMAIVTDHRVVRTGPYRWLRHPNYAGLVLVAFGTALALASSLAVVVTALVWVPAVLVRVLQEEDLLTSALGEDYERYARSTWRLLPGVF
jgi:protein-S-isoprenylcysteine O-methyltransferase Ste14